MKTVLCALFALTITVSAFANETGISASEAQAHVVSEAHSFIARTAPDFGGKVRPCTTELSGDRYTVTCTGIAYDTTGGDGEVKTSFECVGEYNQGQDALLFQVGAVHCK